MTIKSSFVKPTSKYFYLYFGARMGSMVFRILDGFSVVLGWDGHIVLDHEQGRCILFHVREKIVDVVH